MAAVTSRAAKPLAAAAIAQLEADGVATLIGTVVNPAGLTHAKTVPLRRMGAFADPGLGASPVWHVFTIDQAGIVFGDAIGVVGDQRIRIDLSALRILGDGLAWAPGAFFNQDGSPDPYCSRGVLRRVEERLSDAGIDAVVGHEMEFLLVEPDGGRLPSHLWAQYGLAGVLEFEGFIRDVMNAATGSGVTIEQFHPEYGVNQFEISLSPQSPVAAADQLVLMRIIIGRVARRYGLRVSLSPVPFAGSVGSGAHQHFSMKRGETPLFSDGAGIGGHRQHRNGQRDDEQLPELDAGVEREHRGHDVRAGELERLRQSGSEGESVHEAEPERGDPAPPYAHTAENGVNRHPHDRAGDQGVDERRKPQAVGRQVPARTQSASWNAPP